MTDRKVRSNRAVLRAKWKSYLPYALSAVAVAVFAIYVGRNADRYRELLVFSWASLLALGVLALVVAPVFGLIYYFFYRQLGAFLGLNESVGLAAVNALANQLPFAGGLVTKGVYLKQRHQVSYTRFLSATTALYVFFVAVNGAVALAVLGAWTIFGTTAAPLALVLGFSAMTAGAGSLWLPLDAVSLPGKIGSRLSQLGEGWRVLSEDLYLLGIMATLKVLATLVLAGRFWIVFRALSQHVTFGQCVLFSAATVLTHLANITPGGLGVREGIVAAVASLLGFGPGVSAVAVGLDRLVSTGVIIALGTVYSYVLGKKATEPEALDPPMTEGSS